MKVIFEEYKTTKYYIDECGNTYSSNTYHSDGSIGVKKQYFNKYRGYIYVRTKTKNYILHRLVAKYFVKNDNNKPHVNHKDGNKTNNHYTNLEWVTPKENNQHARNMGLTHFLRKNEGNNLKYTLEQCREVFERVKSGMTYIKAGSIYNMPYSTVAHLIRGSRRRL